MRFFLLVSIFSCFVPLLQAVTPDEPPRIEIEQQGRFHQSALPPGLAVIQEKEHAALEKLMIELKACPDRAATDVVQKKIETVKRDAAIARLKYFRDKADKAGDTAEAARIQHSIDALEGRLVRKPAQREIPPNSGRDISGVNETAGR